MSESQNRLWWGSDRIHFIIPKGHPSAAADWGAAMGWPGAQEGFEENSAPSSSQGAYANMNFRGLLVVPWLIQPVQSACVAETDWKPPQKIRGGEETIYLRMWSHWKRTWAIWILQYECWRWNTQPLLFTGHKLAGEIWWRWFTFSLCSDYL